MSKMLEGKVAVVTGSGRGIGRGIGPALPGGGARRGVPDVVTGSGRGIGRGIALALAREGARVVVNDVGCDVNGRGTAEDPAAQVCKEIKELGSEGVPSYDSVAEYESAGQIIATAVKTWG